MGNYASIIIVPDNFQFPSWEETGYGHWVFEKPKIGQIFIKHVFKDSLQKDSDKLYIHSLIHKSVSKDKWVIDIDSIPKKVSQILEDLTDIDFAFSEKGGRIKCKDIQSFLEKNKDKTCILFTIND